ncbi:MULTISPECIES: coenzyme F420-0:L-glutamate ligase [unclassified Sphingomonas]|uniref:coenzyme F420-0:L-glutamate ligase n=1 Tax=unclassified Sphingomonas TaxID=196159 RepID=UPI0006FEEF91|nr:MULTISPECIES: coenzyme F420-0:L-glutamate ligase [unclassified Sphingomonas]KQX20021.1 F420-0--gamma-glutamyl ligase [Sphingomonas sp. Root1294]KQY67270.1 F420-0--gamma-glutamyl ligase [Sphingomonas sp. Root50]KRB90644.1 F420-0--gamma-glutamyl ligase [Sphingomonas sp. Root720]
MTTDASLSLIPLAGVPLIEEGADLASVVLAALEASGRRLADGDIVVLAQKIVSKAEGRMIALSGVTASTQAIDIARQVDKDPRLVELILSEAKEVMRVRKGVLIVRHRLGLVLANAGIDQSNIDQGDEARALLLPVDPDASASALRDTLVERSGADVAVLIIDSLGRAWRTGTVGTAIGIAGMPGLVDLRGREDLHGRRLETSELGLADEVAAAASLIMGQADEGRPIVIVRGVGYDRRDGSAAELIRPRHMDLFA